MATKVGIIYATGSGMVRRCIYPDTDEQLLNPSYVGEGESIHIVDATSLAHPEDSHEIIASHTGIPKPDSRCSVVDPSGRVVNIIHADPAIDKIEGHSLILITKAKT